ncbi:uncharacterized protein V1518DRAFT_84698 [Limtongia smithiae]|uniref:uncharacterized protein n=1 Tax=Limtongia smithiae TaxID=1125753 RepID=UPI0034CE30E7
MSAPGSLHAAPGAVPDHRVRIVSRRACLSCRERKIKCEGIQDCRNCRNLQVACVFVPSHRGGQRRRRSTAPSIAIDPPPVGDALPAATAPVAIAPPLVGALPADPAKRQRRRLSAGSSSSTEPEPQQHIPLSHPSPSHVQVHHHSLLPQLVSAHPPIPPSAPLPQSQPQPQPPLLGITLPPPICQRPLRRTSSSLSVSALAPPPLIDPSVVAAPPPPVLSAPAQSITVPADVLNSILRTVDSLKQEVNALKASSAIQAERQQNYDSVLSALRADLELKDAASTTAAVAASAAAAATSSMSTASSASPATSTDASLFLPQSMAEHEANLRAVDLPPTEFISFFVDVYYECFHPEFAFMLPKPYFIQSMNVHTDAALYQAMFSISCRFTNTEGLKNRASAAAIGSLYPYLTDPMYWVARAERWMTQMTNSIKRLKTTLLLAFSVAYDGDRQRASDLLSYATGIIKAHRLDLIDQPTEHNGTRYADPNDGGAVPSPELHHEMLPTPLERESFRRMYYMIWEQQVIIATTWSSPQHIPAFPVVMRVPSCEGQFASGLRDWNGKSFDFDEFAAAVYSEKFEFVTPTSVTALGVVIFHYQFNSSCFRLASMRLLAEVMLRTNRDMSDEFIAETERRVRMLLRRIYEFRTDMSVHMTLFMTHQVLYTTLMLLHRSRAKDRLVFTETPMPLDGLSRYTENPLATAQAAVRSRQTMQSYHALTDAAAAIVGLLRVLVECRDGREDAACIKVGPFMGFSLGLCIPVIVNKILLDGVKLPSIKTLLSDLALPTASSVGFDERVGGYPSQVTEYQVPALNSTDSISPATDEFSEDASPLAVDTTSANSLVLASRGKNLNKSDLDFCVRCMRLIGRMWRGMWREYEESVKLVGRMNKVM